MFLSVRIWQVVVESGSLVPLYSLRESELITKLTTLSTSPGAELPDTIIYNPGTLSEDYATICVRDYASIGDDLAHEDVYNMTFLNSKAPRENHRQRIVGKDFISSSDFIFATRSYDDVYSVFLHTDSFFDAPAYFDVSSPEPLKIEATVDGATTSLSRGGLTYDSLAYATRGTENDQYTDTLTPNAITIDRDDTTAIGNALISEKEIV